MVPGASASSRRGLEAGGTQTEVSTASPLTRGLQVDLQAELALRIIAFHRPILAYRVLGLAGRARPPRPPRPKSGGE